MTHTPEQVERVARAIGEAMDPEDDIGIYEALVNHFDWITPKQAKRMCHAAALAALTAAGQWWRDISTAPKNGYIIGAWQDGSRWRAAQMFSEYGDSWVDVFSDRIHQPTHWVAPPSTEEVT